MKEHKQHPTMDKQNEGIQDPSEDGDPGRHERFVAVGEEGEKKGLHKGKPKTLIFSYPQSSEMGS